MAEVVRPKKPKPAIKTQDKKKKTTAEAKKQESLKLKTNQESVSGAPEKSEVSSSLFTEVKKTQKEIASKSDDEKTELFSSPPAIDLKNIVSEESELRNKTVSLTIIECESAHTVEQTGFGDKNEIQVSQTKTFKSDHGPYYSGVTAATKEVPKSVNFPEKYVLPCSSDTNSEKTEHLRMPVDLKPAIGSASLAKVDLDYNNISSQKTIVDLTNPEIDIKGPAVLTLGDGERDIVDMQLHNIMNDLPTQLTFKKLYPELVVKAKESQESVFVPQLSPHTKMLYPEIPREPEIIPFSNEELKMFASGSWLENVDPYTEDFLSVANQDKNDLFELLMNYWRCRKQLLLAEAELQTMMSNYKSTKKRLWTFKEEQLTIQGVCADQVKVSDYHRFQTVEMNKLVLVELQRLLEVQADHLHQTLALHAYTSVLSRLQVESYIYRLLNSSPAFRAIAILQKQQDNQEIDCSHSDMQLLKDCISVLFSFTRRIIEDGQFQSDILLWLQKLVVVLHQLGSTGDHLFLLNHILRCPAGISKWAVPFIQIKVLGNPSGVFIFMQALALLMSPIKHRADFLINVKPSEKKPSSATLTGKNSQNWTLVDEGGEEDEDPDTSWILMSEDDLVSLFSQFPFHELFKHLLGITVKGVYKPEATTCQQMMKIIGFASSLIEILAVGLETFNRARYRQLVKRIGQMIRRTICCISDHWAQYVTFHKEHGIASSHQPYSLQKLQVEFDELFLRAVLHVLKAKRLGIWLFMSEMPYGTLSKNMIWKLFYILHCAESENHERLCATVQSVECKIILKDPEHKQRFEQYLSEITSSEGICLLTTFAHMIQPKHENVDLEFVKTVVLEIYEVSYVSLYTREIFSKVGRELLATISTAHPHVISILLDRVRETIEKVGMVSLYLFKELPLHMWKSNSAEMGVIREWLLNYNLSTVENKLACIILEGLNWGLDEQQTLALDPALHTEVALMVLEAYQNYLTDKPYGGLISESIKQVSYLANVVRLGQTPEASFNHWAWELVVRLKLHKNHSYNQQGRAPINTSLIAPDLTESPTLHPLFKAVKAGIPIGCYLALSITSIGHSVDKFCSEGIHLLGVLVQSKHLRAVVHVLDKVLPLFYPCQYYLLKNEQFLAYMQLFLQTDSGVPQGVTQQVTQKVTQHLIGVNYGENVKFLSSLIQVHVSESNKPGGVGVTAVLDFWIQVLMNQHLWHRDKTVLFLLDDLSKVAFLYHQEDCLQKPLYQQHKNALGYHSDRGLLSSLVSWMVAGNITPSFIEGNATSNEVWFSWIIFNMEAIFEEDSQLRRCVELELITKPLITPDQALKKAQNRLKLPVVPSIQRLLIYRWAHQALVTSADHPLLPLIWQKFFVLYLHRPGPEFGLPISGCIGKRYFYNPAQSNLLKEMKKRLADVADFHHAASKAVKSQRNESCIKSASLSVDKNFGSLKSEPTSPELHKELLRLFRVFSFWLEDINLQKTDLYLPSLPLHYDTHRLAKVMQNQQDLWTEYIDNERIKHEVYESMNLWIQLQNEPSVTYSTSGFSNYCDPSSARDRIFSNLKNHDIPQPPACLQKLKAPVPDIAATSLSDKKAGMTLIQQDLRTLRHHAKMAALWESQQVALNYELLEIMPKQYSNREEQITMKLECQGNASTNHVCQGAARISVKYEGLYTNDAIKQQLGTLRKDIKQLQTDATMPPPQNIAEAAVHVENFITTLVNAFKLQQLASYQKVGIAVFYEIVSFVCDETQRHPPTRQFFTSCIEILGQIFISSSKTESQTVLKTILQNRRLCNLLSPYFTPNISPDNFVSLYEEVVRALCTDKGDVIFMLLTKFDLVLWLNTTKPVMSERNQLLELIHIALTSCGLQPEEEIQMPFNIFCKHWMCILRYQFPDHYSDFLRLLLKSSSEQMLSPDCWKATLQTLECTVSEEKTQSKITRCSTTQQSQNISLSVKQVEETIQWLSDFFFKLRLANSDLKSFGLFSKWTPYMDEVKTFWMFLAKSFIDSEVSKLAQESVASSKNVTGLQVAYGKLMKLFRPWLLVLKLEGSSNNRCYPWLEIDTPTASCMVKLFADCVDYLHQSFKDKLNPGQHDALWFHLMHYCETCTAPKMPEYILYAYHSEYTKLPWRELHPDQALMEEFFKVERGSPKSCFLFLGTLLGEVNWVSVLSDAWNSQPLLKTQTMVVYLLFMVVFLSKEDELINKPESPIHNLLGQASSLPWHFVDIVSYQNVMSYFSSHYSPSVVIAKDPSAELTLKLLKIAAGFNASLDSIAHSDATPKCQTYIHHIVQCLITLDQNAQVVNAVLEQEMTKLLDDIVVFNPPGVDCQMHHMAISSLFMEVLTMLNNTSITSAESLRVSLRSWTETRANCNLVPPLLTATCQSLASVKHMAEMTEACIMAYFKDGACHNQYFGWGPILVSLQVPELTADEFLKECLDLGSYLTLYVHILQHLNMEQTLSNEMKMLVLINKWIEEVFPRCTSDEAKLFLWWHKVLQLILTQLEQSDVVVLEFLTSILNTLQMRQSLLAEERQSSGILGAIGLGRKSPFSNRFRVVARSMSAFLLVQIPAENCVRLKPGTDLQPSPKAQQALNILESMSANKQYASYQEEILQATVFIKDASYCLHDSNRLLAVLINRLYPNVHYLDIIR